ncbi:MAG: glycosyltransferase family 39 protein [Chloroflexi bacterium]|nr:glycosyltransferase family 39 protein [Chloroflexota bacterium]
MVTAAAAPAPRVVEGARRKDSPWPEQAVWATAALLLGWFFLTWRLADFPPGLHVDAAVEAFNVQDVLRGNLTVFFPINFGHGALYVYFEALLVALAGTNRLVYALAGDAMTLLGLAVSIRALRALLGWRAATLAGGLLAVSLWVFFIGRIGVWQSTMLAGSAAPVYFLWRVYRFGRRRDALLGGLALGLAQYGYYSIRFLPVFVLAALVFDWRASRQRWRLLALYVGASLLAFLPEGLYFALNPAVVLTRPQQVTIFSPDLGRTLAAIGQGVLHTAGMFFVLGDYRPWQAIPFRPVFDPVLAAAFCLGLVLALAGWRRRALRWLVLWTAAMLLPTALTADPPSFFRALGAAPGAYAFPALGLVWVWQHFRPSSAAAGEGRSALSEAEGVRVLGGALVVAIVLAEAAASFVVYFVQFGPTDAMAVAFDAHDTPMAAFAAAHPGATIYFSDIRTLAGQPVRAQVPATQQAGWTPQDTNALPIPASAAADMYYVGSPRSAIGTLALAWLPGVQTLATTTPEDPRGIWAFRWPASGQSQLLAALRPFASTFGDDLQVVSYASSGSALDVVWRQLQPTGPYDLYTHVLDGTGKQVAQDDKLYFPVEVMGLKERNGEGSPTHDLVLTRFAYQLPPGEYTVELGVVHRSPAELSQLLAAAGQPVRLPLVVT